MLCESRSQYSSPEQVPDNELKSAEVCLTCLSLPFTYYQLENFPQRNNFSFNFHSHSAAAAALSLTSPQLGGDVDDGCENPPNKLSINYCNSLVNPFNEFMNVIKCRFFFVCSIFKMLRI